MSKSEFKYNKKRKHYAYLFKDVGFRVKNIILTSKSVRKDHKQIKKNIRLYRHPNPNSGKVVYVIPIIYVDQITSFAGKKLRWVFHPNDKRKIKRIKTNKKV